MQIIFTDQINRIFFFKETIRSHGIYRLKGESMLLLFKKKELQDKHLVERCYLLMGLGIVLT